MAVNTDRDNGSKMVDRYRETSAELDERPSASVRASILAAAAREVGARPVSAHAPRPIRPRWPLAAAAAVMLSTLAVMMAIRTSEEMPQFNAPLEAAPSAADKVATPAVAPPAPPMAEAPADAREAVNQQAPGRQRAPEPERSVARTKPESDSVASAPREMNRPELGATTVTGRLKKDADSFGQAARDASVPAPTEAPASPRLSQLKGNESKNLELEKSQRTAAAAAPPPAQEPAARAKLRAEQSAAGAAAPTPPMDQASSDARRDAPRPSVPATVSPAQEERKQTDEPAAAWLERIIKLRREGRHVEADAELKRFRERYPHVQMPAEALPPVGTR